MFKGSARSFHPGELVHFISFPMILCLKTAVYIFALVFKYLYKLRPYSQDRKRKLYSIVEKSIAEKIMTKKLMVENYTRKIHDRKTIAEIFMAEQTMALKFMAE